MFCSSVNDKKGRFKGFVFGNDMRELKQKEKRFKVKLFGKKFKVYNIYYLKD